VPAAEELGRRFGRPAFGAFTTGDLDTAFDLFMRGVCGERYRSVLEQRLARMRSTRRFASQRSSSAMKRQPFLNRRSARPTVRVFTAP